MLKNLTCKITNLILLAFFAVSIVFVPLASGQTALLANSSQSDFRHGADDPTFSPLFSLPNNNVYVNVAVPLPDGKTLVGGSFKVVAGKVRTHLARLNSDGTLDDSFNVSITTTSTILIPTVHSLTILPDSKILVGGSFTHVNGTARNNFVRLNGDGSLDTTFATGTGFDNAVKTVAIQTDGKLLIGGNFSSFNGTARACLARLNSDGSLDTSLVNPNISSNFADKMTSIVPLPDGKIFIHGTFSTVNGVLRRGLAKLNADGTLDTSFVEPGTYEFFNFIYAFASRPDGKMYIGGGFQVKVNNQTICQNLCLLNANGTVDTGYSVSFQPNNSVRTLQLEPDGRLLVHGNFTNIGGLSRNGTTRLNEDGTNDQSFNPNFYADFDNNQVSRGNISAFVPLTGGGYLLPGNFQRINGEIVENLAKIDQSGNADPNFATPFSGVGLTNTATLQPDGKILVGGNFNRANGLLRGRIARLNPDGSTDASFSTRISNAFPGTSGSDNVYEIAVQTDGKILIGGDFALVNGESHKYLARLNQDGSLDNNFNPVMTYQGSGGGTVNLILVQPDGKIVIGGIFQTVNGAARVNLARLNADGTLDADFVSPIDTTLSPSILAAVAQPDGKIVIGGDFRFTGGSSVFSVARLNADGSLDGTFQLPANPNTTPNLVRALALASDGKIIAGGSFSVPDRPKLVRFNNDGSIDPTFSVGAIGIGFSSDNVNSIVIQPYGKILIAGSFNGVGNVTRPNIARLLENGKIDYSFRAPQTGTGITSLNQTNSGDLIVTGSFSAIENRIITGIARLRNSFTTRSPYDFDGDGKTDVGIFRPSDGSWWYSRSSDSSFRVYNFGTGTDLITPGDFTGDGRADIAVFRPSTGFWFVQRSEDNSFFSFPFGASGDIPAPADYDGDGKTDAAVFRPSDSTWYIRRSSDLGTSIVGFGSSIDKPVAADYDGDGKADIAIFRPSDGSWWYLQSSDSQFRVYRFGVSTDKPVQGDYTGDGKTDLAVFRPSTGEWFVQRSEDNSFYSVPFGASGDIPSPGDYDGDGRFDPSVFRPSTADWFVNRSSAGILITTFGTTGDRPIPNSFVP